MTESMLSERLTVKTFKVPHDLKDAIETFGKFHRFKAVLHLLYGHSLWVDVADDFLHVPVPA
jgi:hypothetical protein